MRRQTHLGPRRRVLIIAGLLLLTVGAAWTYWQWDRPVDSSTHDRTCGSVREPLPGAPVNVGRTDGTVVLRDHGVNDCQKHRSLKTGALRGTRIRSDAEIASLVERTSGRPAVGEF